MSWGACYFYYRCPGCGRKFKYATDLRSMTQARGSFSMRFERYEEVPQTEAQKIIANAKIEDDDEE